MSVTLRMFRYSEPLYVSGWLTLSVLVTLVSVPTERFVTVDVRFWSTTDYGPNASYVYM